MNCSEAREKIPLLAAGEQTGPELREHVENCEECGTLAREMTGIDATFRETFAAMKPPAGSAQRVKDRIRWRPRRDWSTIVAAAAAILLLLGVVSYALRTRDKEPRKITREPVEPKPKPEPDPEPEPTPHPEPDPGPEPQPEPDPRPEPIPTDFKGIRGNACLHGKPPEPRKISMMSDAFCSIARSKPMVDESLIVTGGKIKNVLVYLKGIRAPFKEPEHAVTLNQDGCVYDPHVVAVLRNQKLIVRNSDRTAHNVHLLPIRNKETNFSQAKSGVESVLSFKIPEIGIKVKCDVHPWMNAWIHVMKHPYFSVTDENGLFEIRDVPPGRYTMVAWHERLGEEEVEVTVGSDGVATACIEFKR